MIVFYAWTAPAFISGFPADHTWVTSFDNRRHVYDCIDDVAVARESFWFCWGGYRPEGTPPTPITAQLGDLALAKCLVQPNFVSEKYAPTSGTIFEYGRDGLCHQLSNQVLFATKTMSRAPATVSGARWYRLSSAIYRDYGLQRRAWRRKGLGCRLFSQPFVLLLDLFGGFSMPDDSFDQLLRSLLGEDDPRLKAMRALREEHQRQLGLIPLPIDADEAAQQLNARNQRFFDVAADLLGAELFEQLFGLPAFTTVNLVDPDQLRGDLAAPGAPVPL